MLDGFHFDPSKNLDKSKSKSQQVKKSNMSSDESDVEVFARRFSAVFHDPFLDVSTSESQKTQIETEDLQRKESKFGDCYIFDYQKFKNPRIGSEKDVIRLKHDFRNLNFNVYDDFKDLPKDETLAVLKKAAKSASKKHKCFVCCFLTHGNMGKLSMADEQLEINQILKCFSHSACENLKGIPKIFIFQACRGECREDGVPCNVRKASRDRTDTNSGPVIDIPDSPDFLLAYSTYDGTVAYRTSEEKKHGSFFIDELCRTFEQFSTEIDLLQMLTVANFRVANYFVTKDDKKKQMPCFTSSLTTKVEFNNSIPPFQTDDTKYFDKRRRESRMGLTSTEKPFFDKQTYEIREPKNIKFLHLFNTENNFENCLLDYSSMLWSSVSFKGYRSESLHNWTKEDLISFLKEGRNYSNIDCLICFIACQAREDHLRDRRGNYFHMRKIVEQFTGKACSRLIEKPKIFVFLMSPPTNHSDSAERVDTVEEDLIPVHSDLLEIIITVQDAEQLGGVIEKFCNIFGATSDEDFLSQLTAMNYELVNKYGFYSPNRKSTFSVNSTLTKTLILNEQKFKS